MLAEKGLLNRNKKEKDEQIDKIPSPELLKIQENLQKLKNDREGLSLDEYKKISFQTYKDLAGFLIDNGADFVSDINQIYQRYNKQMSNPLIVRREDPEKVASLGEGFDISLSFDPKVVGDRGDKYVNCAIWPYGRDLVSGIKNAFLEGRGMAGPLVTLIGIKQNNKNNKVEEADEYLRKVGTIERDAVRIASGKLIKDDLEFIILRIQRDFFPEENMLAEEKTSEAKQIFRGFLFD